MNTNKHIQKLLGRAAALLACLALSPVVSAALEPMQLDDTCLVSILNRTVQASPDGSWRMENVPSFMGQVPARASCLRSGLTESGQTDYFTVTNGGQADAGVPYLLAGEEIPVSLRFTNGASIALTGIGAWFDLRVLAAYSEVLT